jgi:hypothetical protein
MRGVVTRTDNSNIAATLREAAVWFTFAWPSVAEPGIELATEAAGQHDTEAAHAQADAHERGQASQQGGDCSCPLRGQAFVIVGRTKRSMAAIAVKFETFTHP